MNLLLKFINISIVTFLILIVLLIFAMGIGTFLPAKIIYPYSMIFAITKHNFNTIEIVMAFLQGYLYSLILLFKPKWKYYLLAIHVIAIIFVLIMNDTTFS